MLEGALDDLKKINGYKAAALSDYTGDILVSDSGTLQGDLPLSAATMNDIFRSAHKASKDLQLGPTKTMQLNTENGIILMSCSGEESRAHIHIFAIFDKEGNHALAKMTIEKLLPKVVEDITS